MVALRRTAANAAAYDLPCTLVSPEAAQELWPPMRVDDLVGALHLPGDGKVNPTDLTQSLAKGARLGGARVVEGCRVTGFTVADGPSGPRATGVRTDQGDVEADVVVRCGGTRAHARGRLVGVTVPLHAAEHFYVVTEQVEGTHPDLPVMRDPDGWTYFKEEVGGLVVGGFEPDAKPWTGPDDVPYPFEFQLLDVRLGALLRADGRSRAPGARPGEHRHPQVLQRPRVVHARQPVPDGGGAGPARLLRRRRVQLAGHRVGGRGRPGARRVGGGGRAAGGPGRGRRPPVRRLPQRRRRGCARGWRRCSGCTMQCRGPTAR